MRNKVCPLTLYNCCNDFFATASKRVRIKCKDAKVLVNMKDVKQLKELKQWEE